MTDSSGTLDGQHRHLFVQIVGTAVALVYLPAVRQRDSTLMHLIVIIDAPSLAVVGMPVVAGVGNRRLQTNGSSGAIRACACACACAANVGAGAVSYSGSFSGLEKLF